MHLDNALKKQVHGKGSRSTRGAGRGRADAQNLIWRARVKEQRKYNPLKLKLPSRRYFYKRYYCGDSRRARGRVHTDSDTQPRARICASAIINEREMHKINKICV
ncbi:hypothetical protein EVAR_31779_1 [Eumeta japonica]|uniref:Uncharacterized protein n=1 Tax=Eumeta variegata TaxID=151549 RepID=A0A4C1W4E7_EUMVA|nr:hypothetical protein EVAR_31779_1 [Eumeta japonica]